MFLKNKKNYSVASPSRHWYKKRSGKLVILAAVAMFILAGLELTNTTYLFHKKIVPKTIPVTSSEKDDSAKDSKSDSKSNDSNEVPSASTNTQNSKSTATGGGVSSSVQLARPYGNFVSNHHPGQGGSGTKEQSVCNTTPGASCYIKFTKVGGSDTTKLPTRTIGSSGSTLWSWDAKILSSGSWKITAVASLNGKTKSVTDTINLEIR